MTQQGNEASTGNNIWLRGLFMILFGILYSLAGTVLLMVAVPQFILVLTGSAHKSVSSSFSWSLIHEFHLFYSPSSGDKTIGELFQ